jgi:adenosylhomocysteine nucleosidase
VIAIFAAMDTEVRAAIGWTKASRESEVAGFPIYEIDGGVVCRTGIGPRAKQAAEAALEEYRPAVVLSVGVAGGLSPEIDAGEVVVCERIDHESQRAMDVDASVTCTPGLVEAATAAARGMNLPTHVGSSITVDEAAWGPEEKAAHHAWKGHDIVEMESFWIGEAAARRGMPFLTVRTISDHHGDSIVQTNAMREDGTFDQEAFLAYVREHPEAQPIVARQYEAGKLAFTNLSIFCAAFLPPLAQHFAR